MQLLLIIFMENSLDIKIVRYYNYRTQTHQILSGATSKDQHNVSPVPAQC